jgi:threonine dehydratase
VVPVGNGALLAGVGRALGTRSAGTRRVGVVSAGAPVMAWSWRAGRPVPCHLCDSIADGLAVRIAIPVAVEWLLAFADGMLEVSEADIAAAVVAFDDAGIRVEAAAAAALAALPRLDADGPVVLVVTGRNIDDELLARCRAAR